MESKNLAKNLKSLRTVRGMSQEYLAEESQVSLRTIQRIENNESSPTGETIKRIATALDVELGKLTGYHLTAEISDLRTTIVFLKKQRSKTGKKSEIKTFENFIRILEQLKEKDLSNDQLEAVEDYIQYLELERIPSFNNEIFKHKLLKFKKFLKNNLKFIPANYYTTMFVAFSVPFAIGFGMASGISVINKSIVISTIALFIGVGLLMDVRVKRKERAINF